MSNEISPMTERAAEAILDFMMMDAELRDAPRRRLASNIRLEDVVLNPDGRALRVGMLINSPTRVLLYLESEDGDDVELSLHPDDLVTLA